MAFIQNFFVKRFKKIYERIKYKWEELDNRPEWLVSRDQWGAKPPSATEFSPDYMLLNYPVSYVVIHDTSYFDDPGMDSEKIKEVLKEIQEDDMAEDGNGFPDICYNFMVGGDGKVYEGRGWEIQGDHTHEHNEDSIGIAFIGNHRNIPPNSKMLLAAHALIQEGMRKRYLKGDVQVVAHSQLLRSVRCPSKHLDQTVRRGVLVPDWREAEWAWLWTAKRWLNDLPQAVRDHVNGQIEFWIDEWKTCTTRQMINYYWNN